MTRLATVQNLPIFKHEREALVHKRAVGSVIGRWFLLVAAVLLSGLALAVAGAWYLANRPMPPVTPEEIAQHRAKAMQWLKQHEQQVLADPNAALWWMLQKAAQHSGDAYLQDLTGKALQRHFSGFYAKEPWRRMMEPQAEISAYAIGVERLVDYQRFFHHAMTCRPMDLPQGDTSLFLQQDMCSPMWSAVFLTDAVCTTHQVVGLMLIRQTGCAGLPDLGPLTAHLLDDVETQLTWDPLVRDPHYQRLLVLALNQRQAQIKPVWLRRMLQAQEPDGGWLGYRRIPELPALMQPWHWREVLASHRPDWFAPDRKTFDFHATAQVILLLTLLDGQR